MGMAIGGNMNSDCKELTDIFKRLNFQVDAINLTDKTSTQICERLDRMIQNGNQSMKNRKFGEAYTYYKRWLRCHESLQKRKLNTEVTNKYIPNDRVTAVKKLLQQASRGITIEFEAKHNPPLHPVSLEFPDTPSDEPQDKEKDEITCTELSEMLLHEKKVLIFDVRDDEDYFKSCLDFPQSLIHIPADKIEPNKVPAYYRSIISNNSEALALFNKRSAQYTDIVVLIDTNSSLDTMRADSPIASFKNCLEKFDKGTKYNRITVLKGGFEQWVHLYPKLTSVPLKEKSSVDTPSMNAFGNHNFDYSLITNTSSPILSGSHPAGSKVKPLSASNSHILSKNDKNLSLLHNDSTRPYESQPSFPMKLSNNNLIPPGNGVDDKHLLRTNNIRESSVVLEKLPVKPTVDRSNKPLLSKSSTNKIDESESQLDRTKFTIFTCNKSLQKGNVDVWTQEQRDTLLKQEQEQMSELAEMKISRPIEFKSNTLYPDLSKVSNATRARSAQKSQSNLSKENIPEPAQKVKTGTMEIEPSMPQKMDMNDEETYTEPLKSEHLPMNSGLKRSHSSPNLMQQEEKKGVPEFNRQLKPKAQENTCNNRNLSVPSNGDRVRRMEPVYGNNLHPGITGLKNLGNSCYMNSIIQCLSNTDYLANYFNGNDYVNHLNKKYSKGASGYVAEEVAQVIRALWRGQYRSISPRDLKLVVGQYKLQFESQDQQDSHEFLMFLLDWMHNDLKQERKFSYDRPLTTAEKEWEKSMGGQSSIISQLFFGQLRSTIECQYCRKNSTTYETFNSLTLSLPQSKKCTLDECVRKFVSGQNVSGWKCPSCEVPREGIKKFDIAKLPYVIVIHLNRFGDSGGWLEKKNLAVEFPLNKFDLKSYLVQDNDAISNSQNSTSYNLYAMSNHFGTMHGGHYTAYCKSHTQNKWYKYDDHAVNEVVQSEVKNQSSTAYLLFYASVAAEPYLNR